MSSDGKGNGEWDGPLSLEELYGLDVPEFVLKYGQESFADLVLALVSYEASLWRRQRSGAQGDRDELALILRIRGRWSFHGCNLL